MPDPVKVLVPHDTAVNWGLALAIAAADKQPNMNMNIAAHRVLRGHVWNQIVDVGQLDSELLLSANS